MHYVAGEDVSSAATLGAGRHVDKHVAQHISVVGHAIPLLGV